MTEQTARKVPSIRFKGFEGEWITKKVLEICGETYGGGTPKTSDERFWTGNIPWIQSSDLKDLKLYDVKVRKWINSLAISNSATKLIPDNSIAVVTRVGVGKIALIEFSYTTSQDFLSLSKLNINQLFAVVALSILLQSKLHETQGTSIKGLTKEELLGYTFSVPTTEYEQTKIGTYFKNLDQVIELHQQKHKKLITLKKAMLQKMFPQNGATSPEIRFKGFEDSWKIKKLKDISKRAQGNDGRMSLPTLTISAARGWLDQRERFFDNIAGSEQKNYTLLKKGELSYNKGNSKTAKFGVVFELTNFSEALVPRVYHSFKILHNNSASFIEYLFHTKIPDNELSKLISSGARMDGLLNISFSDFIEIPVLIPEPEEQQKIGNYFRKLDTLISQQATQLKKLKQIKAACLEKMFG